MKIDGITEFTSKGYYNKPDSYSEVVLSQNSRIGLPSSVKALLGTRRVQNLCADELLFFGRPVPGPVSSAALSYYKYSFEDTLETDHQKLFKIHFEPIDRNDPGLIGSIYITDRSASILQIQAVLNEAANTGDTFDSISLMQQFIRCGDSLPMPVNYLMKATSNYIGIVKVLYEYSSSIENYEINVSDNEDYDNNTTLSILSVNDKNDSLSWADKRAVPFTREESNAYNRTGSSDSYSNGFFRDAVRILSPHYKLNDHFSISGPLGIYQFNHIEGHTITFTGAGNGLFNNTLDAKLTLSNGFSDKRFKENLSGIVNVNDNKTIKLSLNAYNKLETLFSSSDRYNSITTTIYSLLSSRDFRHYYYTKGMDLRTDMELSPVVTVYASYSGHTDHSARANTDFSLFGNTYRTFRNRNDLTFSDSINIPVYEAYLSTIGFGVNFDFRDDVLENNLKRKVSNGNSFVSIGAGVLISSPKYLGSDIGFISYSTNILGELNTFGTSSLRILINAIYSRGPVPIQMQYALPGNISATGREFTFRTLGVGRMFGDQVLTLNLEYNFRKELYRVLPFSFLKNVGVSSFFNAAWKNMSDKSAAIMPVEYTVLTKPLLESGFSLGYSSLPVNLEFAWRLTYIDRGSFHIGINTTIL
jgi:hypothetical protein